MKGGKRLIGWCQDHWGHQAESAWLESRTAIDLPTAGELVSMKVD